MTDRKQILPVNRGASGPNSAVRTAEWMPSAPTITSASAVLPSANSATADDPDVSTPTHRAPNDTTPAGTAAASTSSRSARCAVAPSMPCSAPCWLRLVLLISRPVIPFLVTAHSDRPATFRTPSSTPIARSTRIALGCSATPAPISRSSAAASYTRTSTPARASAIAAVSPPMPPPMIATRVMRPSSRRPPGSSIVARHRKAPNKSTPFLSNGPWVPPLPPAATCNPAYPDEWEVIGAVRSVREAEPELAGDEVLAVVEETSGTPLPFLRAALAYWGDFPEEVDAFLDRARAEAAQARASWERQQELLGR